MITALCRLLDRESSWWGLRRFKPAPDQVYSSRVLLLVCLVYGLPLAAVVFGSAHLLTNFVSSRNGLIDDSTWFPQATAWLVFVVNTSVNGACCWAWNWRATRLGAAGLR